MLIAAKANINAKDRMMRTPLIRALQRDHKSTADLLLFAGAETLELINMELLQSAQLGTVSEVQTLLDKGADINFRNENNQTAVMIAAFEGHVDAVIELVKRGADCNARDVLGNTALMYSASEKLSLNEKLMRWLNTAISASSDAYHAIAKILITAGADINAHNNDGETPLIYAISAGDCAMVQLLLEEGANPNSQIHKGRSMINPLVVAISRRNSEMVQMLIKAGADINANLSHDLNP